jgi:F-type H+-transporting ATPase subunit b
MRRMRTLLMAALALVALFGFARPAAAQEEGGHAAEDELVHELEEIAVENGATEIDSHCIETIASGGSVDDCHEAPNPLLPELNEIIWGTVGFLVVFLFLAKFGFPAMKKAMDERTEKIRGDIAAAEAQRSEAEGLAAEYRAQLNDAKAEAGRIIEEARQQADALRRDAESRLQAELAETRARAVEDIESSKAHALTDLRGDVAQIAIGAAEAVVQRNLDPATQTQLVEDYINQVAASRS